MGRTNINNKCNNNNRYSQILPNQMPSVKVTQGQRVLDSQLKGSEINPQSLESSK
jgi:hypothetical protein